MSLNEDWSLSCAHSRLPWIALATAQECAGPSGTAAQAMYASLFLHACILLIAVNFSPNMNRSEESMTRLRQELEQTRTELNQARTELNQTRTELGQTKTELNQTKASLDETSQLYDSVNDAYWVFIDYVISNFPSLSPCSNVCCRFVLLQLLRSYERRRAQSRAT